MNICVVIPTYDEAENIVPLLTQLRETLPEATFLVVDDSSPDGTGKLVLELSEKDPKIHLITRTDTIRGRGIACRDGFIQALEWGAQVVVEMDADFSHHPRYLPSMLEAVKSYEVVLGSRFVPGGKETGRPWYRQWITKVVGTFLRAALGVNVRDPSTGFRCWSRKALETLDIPTQIATGPSVVSELLYKSRLRGLTITEVPIVFEDRFRGTSKLDFKTLLQTLGAVFELRRAHKAGKF